jgi:hypothetical protein
MKFVVETQTPGGDIARKEYDAPNMRSVMRAVETELKNFPNFRATDVWQQRKPRNSLSVETW